MFRNLSGRTPGYMDAEYRQHYAVVAPYLPETGEFLFEVRSDRLQRQPGEICFPGGHVESGENPLQAGIREISEELLVEPSALEYIAPLDVLLTGSGGEIHPYLFYLHGYASTFSPDEVKEVFAVPFDYFLSTEPIVHYTRSSVLPEDPAATYGLLGVESYPWLTGRTSVLFYPYENRLIWGLTAKIMYHIATLYRSEESFSLPSDGRK